MSTYNQTDQVIADSLATFPDNLSDNPPKQESGTISLFADNYWDSTSLTLDISEFSEKNRHSIANTSLQDKATWVNFNLPVGIVVTLMENVTTLQEGQSVGGLSDPDVVLIW
jgi:hypothetical protein